MTRNYQKGKIYQENEVREIRACELNYHGTNE